MLPIIKLQYLKIHPDVISKLPETSIKEKNKKIKERKRIAGTDSATELNFPPKIGLFYMTTPRPSKNHTSSFTLCSYSKH